MATAERMAHTLRGVAGNISATGVQHVATLLEEAIISGDAGKFDVLLRELGEAMGAVCASIRLKIKPPPAGNGEGDQPVDFARIEPLMHRLEGYLRKSDPNAVQTMETLREMNAGLLCGKEFDEMDRQVENFDFDIALASLEKIVQKINVGPQD